MTERSVRAAIPAILTLVAPVLLLTACERAPLSTDEPLAPSWSALMDDGDADALGGYDRSLHEGAVGRKLAKLAFAARHFYGAHHRFFFRVARTSRRAHEIGVDWYNGARHLDELPTRQLVARWIRAVLLGVPVR